MANNFLKKKSTQLQRNILMETLPTYRRHDFSFKCDQRKHQTLPCYTDRCGAEHFTTSSYFYIVHF